jgi:hypothetical protein
MFLLRSSFCRRSNSNLRATFSSDPSNIAGQFSRIDCTTIAARSEVVIRRYRSSVSLLSMFVTFVISAKGWDSSSVLIRFTQIAMDGRKSEAFRFAAWFFGSGAILPDTQRESRIAFQL